MLLGDLFQQEKVLNHKKDNEIQEPIATPKKYVKRNHRMTAIHENWGAIRPD